MKPLIIAHRGESYDAPENTLASVNLAWDRGAEGVEIDVHLSADNKVIVIHDYSTKRTGGRNKKVNKQTLDELKQLDVGSWKNEKYKDEKIPTLSEVLTTIPKGKRLVIEVKSDARILQFLKQDIENTKMEPHQIEIISFSYSTVAMAKELMPTYKVFYLADLDFTWYTKLISPSVEKLIARVKKANLDGLNVWAGNLLTKEFVRKIKSSGLLLYVWTVDDVSHAKKLTDWGIDGITTNRAQWLTKKLLSK
jgi:glycerophosphoryl diester phosphodiesterase